MYLLNYQQIKRHIEAAPGQYLDILNFDERKLQHTAYYFSLGNHCEILTGTGDPQIIRLTEEKPYLNVGPHGYAVVQTHEIFFLSDKLIGVLGQTTKLAENGLELVHSPFIDPLYPGGRLVCGLSNRLAGPARLRLGDIIGKISFFDISDTYPVRVIKDSILENTFNTRSRRDADPIPRESEEPDE